MHPSSLLTAVNEVHPSKLCQSFFFIAASLVLFLNSIPAFRLRFVSYGSRISKTAIEAPKNAQASKANENESPDGVPETDLDTNTISRCLDYISTFRVPHSWFTQFYAVSVLSSLFWAVQLSFRGRFFESLASRQDVRDVGTYSTLTINQVFLAWLFMAVQGVRRFYESIAFGKPSTSKMWFVHWILGLTYYLAMGIAVWIEGSTTLLHTELDRHSVIFTGLPSIKTLIAFPLFIAASAIQHDAHFYLSSLKKYTLPSELFFSQIVCPHYTMECLLYLALAIVAAPQGHLINKTIFSGLVFVAVNLGATAHITKEWYAEKFGKEKVEKKWIMFPLVF